MRQAAGVLSICLAVAPGATAQTATANVYGTATDDAGHALPGVKVALEGPRGTRSVASTEDGEFRFLRLETGLYTLRLAMAGFTGAERQIRIVAGDNLSLDFVLALTAVERVATGTADTPLVDIRKRETVTVLTEEELHEMPTARDVWGVLDSVAGVLSNRVNVAGLYNGQPTGFTAKGTTSSEASWSLDGLEITDMSAAGASPTDCHFGALQEIGITSGANDLRVASSGLTINLVTRGGANRLRGDGRFLIAHEDFSLANLPRSLASDPRFDDPDGTRRDQADHIQQSTDYGFDLSGPFWKDRLWFQVGWGEQDIRLVRLVGTRDRTRLAGWNARLSWQAGPGTMVALSWFDHRHRQSGRTVHGSVQEADSFLGNRDMAGEDDVGGPTKPPGLFKLQVDHAVSSDFFISARVAYFNTGFTQTPRGGTGQSFTIDYDRGQAIGSSPELTAVRPQHHMLLDGNYFMRGLGGSHELRFGFGYRKEQSTSLTHYGGSQLVGSVFGPDNYEAVVARDGMASFRGTRWSGYAGDVFTKGRTSWNLGLRWDGQTARNLASAVPAHAAFPELLPAVVFDGDGDSDIYWSTLSPRVGVGYALDDDRRTVLRASYALYAQQLPLGWVADANPAKPSFLAYDWDDANGDRLVQQGEVDRGALRWSSGVDPANPASAGETVDTLDRGLNPLLDHEVVVAVDRQIGASLAVGATYTWRRTVTFAYTPRMGEACGSAPSYDNCSIIEPQEYTAGEPVTANGYTALAYSPPAARVAAGQGGRLRTNAPGYDRTYGGLELTLTKRLANRWMARAAFTWHDWSESWHGAAYSSAASWDGNPTPTQFDPHIDGGEVTLNAARVTDSNIKWQLYGNALVQLGWDLTVSTALLVRQGSVYPVSLLVRAGLDGTLPALAFHEIDSLRYDTVFNADLRLAKTVGLGGDAALVLSAEWFNVANSELVLGRYVYANGSGFTDVDAGAIEGRGRIEEIIGPSVLRFGARLTF